VYNVVKKFTFAISSPDEFLVVLNCCIWRSFLQVLMMPVTFWRIKIIILLTHQQAD